MTRQRACELVYYLHEGHEGDVYEKLKAKALRGANGERVRFNSYEKEIIQYKYESMFIDKEEREAIKMITGY